jgi:hypothetical protein
MLDEIQLDEETEKLYISPRLTPQFAPEYAAILKHVAAEGHDESFAAELSQPGRLNTHESRKTIKGVTSVKVPVTAPVTLSEGEFNRFYIRGLCARAVAEGITHLQVYRAKDVTNPRMESEVLIGKLIQADQLLADLRASIGIDTVLGLPPGPNSGLSVRIPL